MMSTVPCTIEKLQLLRIRNIYCDCQNMIHERGSIISDRSLSLRVVNGFLPLSRNNRLNEIFGISEAHETERIFPNQSIKAVRDGSCYSPQIQHLRCIVLRVVISLLEPEKKKQCRLYSGQSLWPVIKFSREIPAYDSGAIWYYCLNLFLVLSETLFSTGTLLTFVWHPYV